MSDKKAATGGTLTLQDLEEAAQKALKTPPTNPILVMDPNLAKELDKLLNHDWRKELEEKKKNFEALFHKGVVLRHKGSQVTWTIESTFENFHTHERRCRIRSEKGYTKELNRDQVNHYEVVEVPEAVKVLFSQKDE